MNFLSIAKIKRLAFLFLIPEVVCPILSSVAGFTERCRGFDHLNKVLEYQATGNYIHILTNWLFGNVLSFVFRASSKKEQPGRSLRVSAKQKQNKCIFRKQDLLASGVLLQSTTCSNMILAFQLLCNHIWVYGMRVNGSVSWSTSFTCPSVY